MYPSNRCGSHPSENHLLVGAADAKAGIRPDMVALALVPVVLATGVAVAANTVVHVVERNGKEQQEAHQPPLCRCICGLPQYCGPTSAQKTKSAPTKVLASLFFRNHCQQEKLVPNHLKINSPTGGGGTGSPAALNTGIR